MTTETTKQVRGFACMTPEMRSEIARKGGQSVPKDRRSFSQSHDLAVSAGRAGGLISRRPPAAANTSVPQEPANAS